MHAEWFNLYFHMSNTVITSLGYLNIIADYICNEISSVICLKSLINLDCMNPQFLFLKIVFVVICQRTKSSEPIFTGSNY